MWGFGIDASFSQAIVIMTRPLRARAGPPGVQGKRMLPQPPGRSNAVAHPITGLTISGGAQGYPKVLLIPETARKE
jgi:hypothetical protein